MMTTQKDIERFLQEHRQHFVRVAASVLSNYRMDPWLAEDVVQDASLLALRKAGSGSGYDAARGAFVPWFSRVVRNRAISVARQTRYRRSREVSLDVCGLFGWDGGIAAADSRLDLWHAIEDAIEEVVAADAERGGAVRVAFHRHVAGVSRRAGARDPDGWGRAVDQDLGRVLSWLRCSPAAAGGVAAA